MNFIIRLLITAAVSYFLPKFVPGVYIPSFSVAIVFAIVLAVVNIFVKPILSILGFPLTIITLGLFALVINTVTVMIAGHFVSGMKIDGFGNAFIFSLLLSILTSLLSGIFAD